MRPAAHARPGNVAATATRHQDLQRLAQRGRSPHMLVALALALGPWPAWALFKVVAPDGSVTYTDRPPPPAAGRVLPLGRSADLEPPAPAPTLPPELRAPVQRHPVTLFTAPECTPCDAARRMLQQRGVPYTERRVESNDDVLALEQRVGGRTVPALTVGTQALRGYAFDEWTSYLDAAGYPSASRLPRNWQPPPATPLAPRRAAEPPAAPAPPPAPSPGVPRPPPPPPPPPGSIRF